MGRRKKSQASKLTSGQDDDPHDNLSEIRKALVENAALQAQLKKELCLLRASEPETKSPNPTVVAGSSKRRPSAQGSLNMLPASYVLDPCPSECGKSVASMKQPKQAEKTKSESVASMKQPKQAEETKCESVASMKQPKQAEETKCESVASMKQPKQAEETKCESVASMKQPKQAEETKCESVASMKQPKQAEASMKQPKEAEETKCESVASMQQPKQAEETKCEGTVKKRCKPIAKQSWKPPITGMPFWLQAPLPETELLPRRK